MPGWCASCCACCGCCGCKCDLAGCGRGCSCAPWRRCCFGFVPRPALGWRCATLYSCWAVIKSGCSTAAWTRCEFCSHRWLTLERSFSISARRASSRRCWRSKKERVDGVGVDGTAERLTERLRRGRDAAVEGRRWLSVVVPKEARSLPGRGEPKADAARRGEEPLAPVAALLVAAVEGVRMGLVGRAEPGRRGVAVRGRADSVEVAV